MDQSGLPSQLLELFAGAARDAALLLTTLSLAGTDAPTHECLDGDPLKIPPGVVWAGRKADASEAVDGKTVSHGLIAVHSDSPVLTLLDAGKDMVSDVPEELKDLARC